MKHWHTRILGTVVLALLGTAAHASAVGPDGLVSLTPQFPQVVNGDLLGIDLSLNAPDSPGFSPGSFHGIVVLEYDPAVVMFDSFEFTNPAEALGPVTTSTHGAGATVEVAFQNAFDVGDIGTFFFNVNGMDGDVIDLSIRDGDDFFGSFTNTVPTIQPIYPNFQGTTVNVVPIPAAVWLFISALGLAAGVARRRR